MTSSASSVAAQLWLHNELPASTLSHLLFSGETDTAINSAFKLGVAAQASIGLSALSVALFHQLRTGIEQDVLVDARHAVLEFASERWYTVDGEMSDERLFWDSIAGSYETKDGSYVRIHTNFPHHRKGILDILRCDPSREAVSQALRQWTAEDFQAEAAARNMCAAALQSPEEWDLHPQGIALAELPCVRLVRIGDAPKRVVGNGRLPERPLDGIRVLDLTRVLAGPVCGRTLAAHGADVLLVTSPNLPALPLVDIETSRGKRTTQLDLILPEHRSTLISLAREADVFLQAYRPGGLSDKGFGTEDLTKMRPGIVYASLTGYGWEGPWRDRRGFDSLVQTATGFNVAEAEAYAAYVGGGKGTRSRVLPPKPLPMQALDHAAGYLLAFGVNAALCKTVTEGGSWEVRVSLACVGQWIRTLGLIAPYDAFSKGWPLPARVTPPHPEIAALLVTLRQSRVEGDDDDGGDEKPRRMMRALKHSARLEKTPVREGEAPMRLNMHRAEWLPRKVYVEG